MTELEKAARAVVESAVSFGENTPMAGNWTCAGIDALRAALEAEAGWETIATFDGDGREYSMHAKAGDRIRWQRRPLVDYSRDQALHPHEGDGDICTRCGEHRSWHDDA